MKLTDPFNIVKRSQSLTHALRGIVVYAKTTPNFWFHFVFALVLVALGIFFSISALEWLLLIFANLVVLVAEAFNSAIEIDIDLTSPEYHPFARDTKDVAAGAVLLTGIAAWVVDIFIFAPKILALFY